MYKGQNYDKHHKILPKIDTFNELIKHHSTITKIISPDPFGGCALKPEGGIDTFFWYAMLQNCTQTLF